LSGILTLIVARQSAAIELRRRFPGIIDNAKARACARTIAGWQPPSPQPGAVIPLRPGVGPE
jgi:hypothetical protein